jgi:hypothetical protein
MAVKRVRAAVTGLQDERNRLGWRPVASALENGRWRRYSRQTPLRDVAPALNGRASLARLRPCRTAGARFTVARARGRARRRA